MQKIKRNRIDQCNICLKMGELSWDHVPPKGGIQLTSVEVNNIYELITHKPQTPVIYQNGMKYRTICRDCNSLVGTHYDKVLNQFNRELIMYLQSSLVLPRYINITTQPVRLVKAVLAHLLSAKTAIDNVVFDNTVRNVVLDVHASLPPGVHVFYWVYPYYCTRVMRDFAMPAVRGKMYTSIFCHVFKYFPAAFLVSDQPSYEQLPSLSAFNYLDIDDERAIRIDLKRVETFDWPERVDEGNIIFASAETLQGAMANPRKK